MRSFSRNFYFSIFEHRHYSRQTCCRLSGKMFALRVFLISYITWTFGSIIILEDNRSTDEDLERGLAPAEVAANLPVSEMQALQDLYDSTRGDHWHWKSETLQIPWNFSNPDANPCTDQWQGVACLYDGGEYRYVRDLMLVGYVLNGTLPSSINQLPQLERLALCNNSLVGTIPDTLGDLNNLQHVELCRNYLTGTLPSSMQYLTQLVDIIFGFNSLVGHIPDTFGDLVNLEVLALHDNRFNGTIPSSLGNLSQLELLYLQFNQLHGTIPASLGNLSQLQDLDLDTNSLTGTIPDSLGNLAKLIVLALDINDIEGTIPESLGNLGNLQQLRLFSNHLTGPIPATLGNLSQLNLLDAYLNKLTGPIPVSFGNLHLLQQLSVSTNKLTGIIPEALRNLHALDSLNLGSNRLTGTIPDFLSNYSNLTYLAIHNNSLVGPIPACLGNLTKLQSLIVNTNRLTGTIPTALSNLDQLQLFSVSTNLLTGTLPDFLGNYKYLQYLFTFSNSLEGTIPASLGNLTQLLYLTIAINKLSGTIPASLSNLHMLQCFSIESNVITGTLPDYFGRYADLQYLDVSNNSLVGTLPASLGNLSALFELSVARNYFEGTIPRSIARIPTLNSFVIDHNSFSGSLDDAFDASVQTKLVSIVVNNNQLTGTIPSAIFELVSLNTLVASTNCFHGQVPANICTRTSLITVIFDGLSSAPVCKNTLLPDLSRSYILDSAVHGTVPACLFQLPSLLTLHLSGNGFTGSILPDDGPVSALLIDLSLSHNVLTGTIPFGLQNKTWVKLDLSYNRLQGSLSPTLAARDIQVNRTYEYVRSPGNDGQMTLSLENNRLSGRIPQSVQTLQDVSVLGTNTFSCKLDGSDLPQHDSGVSNYQCGSSEFDVPYYVWLGLCCLSAATLVFCVVKCSGLVHRWANIDVAVNNLRAWERYVASCGKTTAAGSTEPAVANVNKLSQCMHIQRYCHVLDTMTKHAALWTAVILVVLLPLYAALSHYYGTYLQAYAWTVSAAYLSGAVPFGLEMVLWLVLLCLALFSVLTYGEQGDNIVSKGDISASRQQVVMIYVLFLGLSIFIVGGVNVAYVYVSIYHSSQLLTFAQIVMSFFKAIFNGGASARILQVVVRQVTGESFPISGYASLQAMSALVNNIFIPFVVVIIVSPSCFYNVFAAAPSVDAVFTYEVCAATNTVTSECIEYELQPDTSSYDPPFTYSYQCSSSLITYYAPAFVNLCIVSMFVMPTVHLLAMEALRRADKSTRWFQLLNKAVPTTWKLPAIGETSDTMRTYFNPLKEQLAQLNFVALIFTFGVVFPPLAAALAVTLVVCTVITKLKLGRLLQHVCDHDGGSIAQSVELACESLLGSALLRDFAGMLSVIACLFYALFLFDTLGDAVGFHKAYWVLIVVPLLPVCAICAQRALGEQVRLCQQGQSCSEGGGSKEQTTVEMSSIPLPNSTSTGMETLNVLLEDTEAQ